METSMNQTTPTKDELKLIIDNALLEQEKRISKTLSDAISDQNKQFTDHIVTLTSDMTEVKVKIRNIWAKMIGIGAACATLGALLAYLIDHAK